MYINKIDELIDNIMDDYFNAVVAKKKALEKFYKEVNFVKYQVEVNKILMNYGKTINVTELNKLITNADNIRTIVEILKRYIAYYTFLYIGYFYEKKEETYINNIIEFTKNQSSFKLKIDNFFNSESNSNIIELSTLIKSILKLISADSTTLEMLAKNPKYKSAILFLNEFGQEFVTKNFLLKNLRGNKREQAHNIIKTVILSKLYFNKDKLEVFRILEEVGEEEGEHIYIDIVIPKKNYIDFNVIESVLTEKEVESGMAHELYELITNAEELQKVRAMPIDEKILKLINKKILVPISEDFLLYHKDNEKYEKIKPYETQKKKKEDTKIRYIVSKIDDVTEYYSANVRKDETAKKNIEKMFYMPLKDRRAILVNNTEEIRIIKKLHNQGRRSIENNEYYNDLMNYRRYPYINYKDFKKYGFTLKMNKTLDMMRGVTLEEKERTQNRYIQLRIGSDNQRVNIIGFLIPTNIAPLQCIKGKHLTDIRTKVKGSSENGYKNTVKFLSEILGRKKKYSETLYWMLDPTKDEVKLKKYEQENKMSDMQHIKLIVASVYDRVMELIYKKLMRKMTASKEISFYDFKRIMREMGKEIMEIPMVSELYYRLESEAYEKRYIHRKAKYDKKEDIFHGLYGDVKKLPTAPKRKKSKVLTIDIREIMEEKKEKEEMTEVEKYGAICQHLLTWENIRAIRKKNPNKFTEQLFEFINQYVVINNDDDYICKSCGTQINIKNYVIDGEYDDNGKFITLSTPMEIPLEDIPEYEKYKLTIRNLDKIIERIASICNITYFLGTGTSIVWRKRGVIKNVIDMLLIHNKNMRKIYKERKNRTAAAYGIDSEMTSFFVFELENSIFIYSSKDKDYYKPIKQNNVLIYILLMMLLELNDSQILLMGGDKTCNYYWFEKYGYSLFNGLMIKTNNLVDVVPMKNYKTLCYLIYFTSCMITKYNMWYSDSSMKVKKFDPIVQKRIIHTLIDCMNSILEIYGRKQKHYLYEVVAVKFFKKLQTTFINEIIIDKLKKMVEKKIIVDGTKRKYVTTQFKSIKLMPFIMGDYMGEYGYEKCAMARHYMRNRKVANKKHFNINNVTNCEIGTFHKWDVKDKTLECAICEKQIDRIKLDTSLTQKIMKRYAYIKLRRLAEKYCISGRLHKFVQDTKINCNICTKCKIMDISKIPEKELDELGQNINKIKNRTELRQINRRTRIQTKRRKYKQHEKEFIGRIKSNYGRTKNHREDYFNHLNKFANVIESIIGKNININNKHVYLKYDTYIINHDHNGYSMDKPIIITDRDNKIKYKKDHPFFKTDTLYYTNYKAGRIDVFYDSTTLLLLGYKELNKEYQHAKVRIKHIKIKYSIMNKLKLLGYPSRYINISKRVKELNYLKDDQAIIKKIVSDLNRIRIHRLKQLIIDVQRHIYRIKYKYDEIEDEGNDYIQTNLVKKYESKLNKMKLLDKNNKNRIFKGWKYVKYGIFFQNIHNKTININITSKYISEEDASDYDYHGNVILFYIISEFRKLLNYNNKFIKINMIYLIFDILENLHRLYNEEYKVTNSEIKRFNYILNSKSYVYDVEEKGHGLEEGEREGIYGEYKDIDDVEDPDKLEALDIAQEEMGAIDMEDDMDYEIDYAPGVNIG